MGSVTHTPKAGAQLTGTEYETDPHNIALDASDIPTHSHAGEDISSGTVADARVASTIARDSEVTTAVSNHVAAPDPHTEYVREASAEWVDLTDGGGTTLHSHAGSGAPTDADYLVGTANGSLSGEIVVGTSPGGELGGTWASPTVDATHAGSTHVSLGTTPSTQAFGDAAAGGSATDAAKTDHKHGWPALGTTAAAIGTSAGGSATTPSKSDHVHATGAGTPSTQAFADAATTGSGPAASMTDHKHAMPTLGYGLSGNSAPAVGLSTVSAAATATTTVSTATYADITGLSTGSLAAGTWLLIATVNGSMVNAHALMHVAITHSDNTVQREASTAIPASGSANVASNGSVTVVAIVTGGATYKVRGARGNTTLTGSWVAMDGTGVGVTNNLTDNSDKGSHIIGIRLA